MTSNFCLRTTRILAAATALSLLIAAGPDGAPDNGAGQPSNNQGQAPGRPDRQAIKGKTLTGTVTSYNLNPAGTAESMMLNTGKSTVQLNFPPELATTIQSAAAVGSTVTAVANTGGPGGGFGGWGGPGGPDDDADHDVMNLESIKGATGNSIAVGNSGGENGEVTGTVKQVNYDRRGSVNGAQLDDGTFVHLRFGSDADFTVGEKVTVEGKEHTATNGIKIIEAETINGKSAGGFGPGGRGGPGGGGPVGPGGGGDPGGPPAGGAPGQ